MPRKQKYPVVLTAAERQELSGLLSAGTAATRVLTHARILLKADQGAEGPAWTSERIAVALEVCAETVRRVRRRFHAQGLEAALHRKEQANRKAPRLDGRQEAHLIALACGEPPEGRSRWTLRLLADRMVALEHVEAVSHETVRQALKRGR